MKSRRIILAMLLVVVAGLALWRFQTKPAPLSPTASPASAPLAATPLRQITDGTDATPDVSVRPVAAPPVSPGAVTTQLPESSAPHFTATPVNPGTSLAAAQTSAPKPQTQNEETAATARMYAAHASLRTPEVADPDSKANKQILQTMVLKALAQGSSQPLPQTEPKDSGLRTIAPVQAGGQSLGREHATTGNTGPAATGNGAQQLSSPAPAQTTSR